MKIRLLPIIAGLTAFSTLPLLAGDVVKKKSGETFEGEIVNETATEVHIEVKLGGITEVKKVQKSDIAPDGLQKQTPDVKAAEVLAKLLPTPDLMTAKDYETVITEKLKKWMDTYKTSRKKADVEKILKTYEEELAKVKTGAIKIEGQWITGEEMKWNKYNVDARMKRVKIGQLLEKGADGKPDPVGAYMAFMELEQEYGMSTEVPIAIELMRGGLDKYETVLTQAASEQPARLKAKETSIKSAASNEKLRIIEAYKKEEDAWKARAAEEKAKLDEYRKTHGGSSTGWIPPWYALDARSIQDALSGVKREKERLAKLDLEKLKAANNAFKEGMEAMNKGGEGVALAVTRFTEVAKYHTKDVEIKNRLKEATQQAALIKEQSRESAPPPAVVPSTTTPGAGDKKPTDTDKPKSTDKPKTTATTPAPSSEPAAPRPAAPVEEESDDLLTWVLLGAAGLLVVVFLVSKLMGKKKVEE